MKAAETLEGRGDINVSKLTETSSGRVVVLRLGPFDATLAVTTHTQCSNHATTQ